MKWKIWAVLFAVVFLFTQASFAASFGNVTVSREKDALKISVEVSRKSGNFAVRIFDGDNNLLLWKDYPLDVSGRAAFTYTPPIDKTQTLRFFTKASGDENVNEFTFLYEILNNNSTSDNNSTDGIHGGTGAGGTGGGGGARGSGAVVSVPITELGNGDTAEAIKNLPPSFYDITDSWARTYILYLSEKGIIRGVGEGLFAPDKRVERCEFLSMITRLLGNGEDTAYNLAFADVSASDWFAVNVQQALNMNLIANDTHFRPHDEITRAEMTKIIVGAYEFASGKTAQISEVSFSDVSEAGEWAIPFIGKALSLGFVNGYEDGAFRPKNGASRAEAAAMIYRLALSLEG